MKFEQTAESVNAGILNAQTTYVFCKVSLHYCSNTVFCIYEKKQLSDIRKHEC
jgi:hypothetical protein